MPQSNSILNTFIIHRCTFRIFHLVHPTNFLDAMISIDFWNTLVHDETGGNIRREVRIKALREVASNYTDHISDEDYNKAKRAASEHFHQIC